MSVPRTISPSSRPYFRQNMVPYDATGMPISTVFIRFTVSSTPTASDSAYTAMGMTSRRNAAIAYVRGEPRMWWRPICAIEEPITKSAPGTVMLPNRCRGSATTRGTASQPNATMAIDRYDAIMAGQYSVRGLKRIFCPSPSTNTVPTTKMKSVLGTLSRLA